MNLLHRVTVALRTVIGVPNRGGAMPSRRGVRRTRHRAAAVVLGTGPEPKRGKARLPRARRRRVLTLDPLESKTAPSAGLVPTAGISPAAEVASHALTGRLARLAR